MSDLIERIGMQRICGTKNTPTPLTYELRRAVGGGGGRAYDWKDKPHRLLYDACSEIEAQQAEIARLREALRPFAEMATCVHDGWDDGDYMTLPEFKAGDYRRARAVWGQKP